MKTYKRIDFSNAPNMPKGYPSEIQARAAAETEAPGLEATFHERKWGWIVNLEDGEGNLGSIVQNGTVHWWCGEKCRASTRNPPFHLQRKNSPLKSPHEPKKADAKNHSRTAQNVRVRHGSYRLRGTSQV